MPPQFNVGHNWSKYLTPEHEITGDLNPDMGVLIDEAISKAENDETRNEYKRMKQFYEEVQQIAEREMAGYDEYGYPKIQYAPAKTILEEDEEEFDDSAEALTESEKAELDEANQDRENDSKIFSKTGDFTPDELEQMNAEIWKKAKSFYGTEQQAKEGDPSKYDEYGLPKIQYVSPMTIFKEDEEEEIFTEKLEGMSTEDLEEMLKTTEDENEAKKKSLEELKKKELIAKIKNAVKEGKTLDAEIAAARETTKEK
ncbi:MAG: hypothetical protein K6B70_05400 [Clostridia bacterium]|nr:hypothetical protein [Clostridia bacterium]